MGLEQIDRPCENLFPHDEHVYIIGIGHSCKNHDCSYTEVLMVEHVKAYCKGIGNG